MSISKLPWNTCEQLLKILRNMAGVMYPISNTEVHHIDFNTLAGSFWQCFDQKSLGGVCAIVSNRMRQP